MNRRDFLKLGGTATLPLFLPLDRLNDLEPNRLEVQVNGLSFRGTADGKIYTSSDRGVIWTLHTYLGPEYSVLDLYSDRRGQVYARVGFQAYSFFLALSADLKRWRTAL
jgi:hypothetical protein